MAQQLRSAIRNEKVCCSICYDITKLREQDILAHIFKNVQSFCY